jgi:hypothetical protein
MSGFLIQPLKHTAKNGDNRGHCPQVDPEGGGGEQQTRRRPHRHRSLHPKPNQTAPIESQQSNHCIEDRSSGFTKIIASKPPSNTHKKVHINVWVFNSTIEAHSKKRRQPRPLSSGRSGGRWRRATNQKTTSSPPFIAPKTKSNRSNRIPTIQSLHRRSLFWVHKDHSFRNPHRIHTKKFT